MQSTRVLRIVISFGIIFFYLHGKSQTYYAKNFTTKDGLCANNITAICQDKKGFLWLLAQGNLVQFDGQNFHTITKGLDSFKNAINFLAIDNFDNIILQAENKILLKTNGSFKALNILDAQNIDVVSFYIDSKNYLWVGNAKGQIYRYQIKNNQVTETKIFSTQSSYILSFYEDSTTHCMYVGGLHYIYTIENNSLSLLYTWKQDNIHSGAYYNIYKDKDGNLNFIDNYTLVLDSQKKNILYTNNFKKEFSSFVYLKNQDETLFQKNDTVFINDGVKNNLVNISSLKQKTDVINRFGIVDKQNNYWLPTNVGLLKIAKYPISVNNIYNNPNHYGKVVLQDYINKTERVFFTDKLNFYYTHDGKTELFLTKKNFTTLRKSFSALFDFLQCDIKLLQKKILLFFWEGNVYTINIAQKKIVKKQIITVSNVDVKPKGIASNGVWLKIDEETKILFYDGYKVSTIVTDTMLQMIKVFGIIQLPSSKLVVASDKGLFIYDGKKLLAVNNNFFNHTDIIVSILKLDSNKIALVNNKRGIILLQENTNTLVYKNLISNNKIVDFNPMNAFLDNQKRIWLFNYKNVCIIPQIDTIAKIYYTNFNDFYYENPFLILSIYGEQYGSKFSSYENKIWNLSNNIYSINLDSANSFIYKYPLQPYFYNVVFNNYKYNDSISSLLFNKQYQHLTLSANQNNISIQFGIKNFKGLEGLKIDYYLQGFDDSAWNHQTNLGLAEYTNLPSGNYTFHIKIDAVDEPEINFSFTILPPWYKTWWAYGLWLFLISSAIFYFIKWRINLNNKKAINEKIVAESKLKAIRAQINPHLIQNTFSLLAINIFDNTPAQILKFIETVSDYFREVLYKSEESIISLEDELEYIEKYLKVQQLMSPGLFKYTITIDDNADTFGVRVPSMLLQPIVENCIKHGFKNIRKDGLISIEIIDEKLYTTVLVKDNGAGITEQSNQPKYTSFGTNLTLQRLKIIYTKTTPVINLFNNTNNTNGACLKIKLPKIK